MLAGLVKSGQLPPLAARLPQNPKIITPRHELGKYGGSWHMATVGAGNLSGIHSRNFYTSLIHWAMDWESLEPGIAEKWEVSADGRAFTFFLRPGLKFSDGHPFTTADVAFVVNHVVTNKKLSPTLPEWFLQNGKRAEFSVLDKYRFRFTFPEPNGVFILRMAVESAGLCLPQHYLRNFIPPFISEAKADSIATSIGYSKWSAFFTTVLSRPDLNPDLPVLYPWIRKTPRDKAATQWIFERNPYYYAVDSLGRQLPYFDRVIISNVSDTEQIYLKAISGEIDCQERHIDGDRARFLLQNQVRGNYRVLFFPTDWVLCVYLNQTEEGDSVQWALNRDKRFRLALSLAIDREEIDKLLNWGQGEDLAQKVIPPGYENAPELLQWFQYDPEKANRLLDEVGLTRQSDGLRRRPDNKQIVLTVYIIDYLPIDYLELVREFWLELGIRLNIKKISYRSWWDFAQAFKFDAASYYNYVPSDRTLILSPNIVLPYNSATYWGGKWGLWYASKGTAGEKPPVEVLELLEIWKRIKHEINEKKQMDLINLLRYKSLKMGHTIYIKSLLPGINIAKTNFCNLSSRHFRENWPKRGPGPDYPETYFKW